MEVLIVDDEGNIRRMIRSLLEAEGWRVREASSAEVGIAEVKETAPEVVLLDLALPGKSGIEALPEILRLSPGLPVVMMSGQATLGDAVEATRLGAFHFLEKPLNPEGVLVTLRGALEVGRARALTRVASELPAEERLVGRSEAIEAVRETVRRAASSDARILVTGESGTGKELVASAIHELSPRAGRPFVRVNSAAIPHDLVESEMFGHEKGAFTGAAERRRGRFELADGGTLFLDEVADLSSGAQAKLLRVLESGEIERVGGTGPIPVDVRVIAATNRDLHRAVEEGDFREDLLFRLEVVPIRIPPLRARRSDIPLLLEHVLHRLRSRQGLRVPAFTPGAVEALTSHDWPGNVRELFNVVERLAILGRGEEVESGAVQAVLEGGRESPGKPPAYDPTDGRSLSERLESYERALIEEAIARAEGNIAAAARSLDTDRANLYRRLKRLDIPYGDDASDDAED